MQEIILNTPVEVDGIKYEFLNMREAKVKDMELVNSTSQNEATKEINLFANLCEVTPSVIKELSLKDYAQLQECFKGFF